MSWQTSPAGLGPSPSLPMSSATGGAPRCWSTSLSLLYSPSWDCQVRSLHSMYPVSYLAFVATSLQNNVTMVVAHNVLLLLFSVNWQYDPVFAGCKLMWLHFKSVASEFCVLLLWTQWLIWDQNIVLVVPLQQSSPVQHCKFWNDSTQFMKVVWPWIRHWSLGCAELWNACSCCGHGLLSTTQYSSVSRPHAKHAQPGSETTPFLCWVFWFCDPIVSMVLVRATV